MREEEEPLAARLKRLRDAAKLSREALARATWKPGRPGISSSAVVEFERGRSRPKLETIALLAEALGVEATEFPEYRLAIARRELDEREVGLEHALDRLAELEGSDPILDGVGREVDQLARVAKTNARSGGRSKTRAAGKRRKSA